MNIEFTRHLILRICIQPRTLEFIVQKLKGVDPMSLLKLLQQLEMEDKLVQQEDLWLIKENANREIKDILATEKHSYLKKFMGDLDSFKLPHPLDFEWRNTKKSVDYLSEFIIKTGHVDDKVLILGMPTMFANICRRDISQEVTIVERNQGVLDLLNKLSHKTCKVIEADLFKVVPTSIGNYNTVVMDPPWYEEHFMQFIWVANQCLELGGRLIISIPPINTRPNISEERIKWFGYCQAQGLCLENLFAGQLQYTMPFFEYNAMRMAGGLVSPFWRHGDVAIFQKLHEGNTNRPNYEEEVDEWQEVDIDSCRIRVKISSEANSPDLLEDFTVNQLVKGEILPTVSNREPIRKRANVFTSGNRIFETNDPKKLFKYLTYFSKGISEDTNECRMIFEFIERISNAEIDEHNNYLGWLYYEMERESF
jgi:hypothetical protein